MTIDRRRILSFLAGVPFMARATRSTRMTRPVNGGMVASLISTGIIGGSVTPVLQFLLNVIPEDAPVGTRIGTLSILNVLGGWSFSKVADPDGKFAVNATTGAVTLAVALDYETKTAHSVTFEATNGLLTLRETFIVVVSNVIEGTLGPTTASFVQGTATGTSIATVTGLDAGASEALSSISPNDGRLSLQSGNRVVIGASAAAPGTINAVITTSANRTLTIAITIEVPPLVLFTPTVNMLAAMGATQAEWDAIAAKGLKEVAPSGMNIGRAIDPGRIDNGRGDGNYISSRALARDFNMLGYENPQKPLYERTEGVTDWSAVDTVDAQVGAVAPAMLMAKNFHLGFGWLPYHQAWTVSKIQADPASIKTYVESRIAQIEARYQALGAAEKARLKGLDVENELTDGTAVNTAAVDHGWRSTGNFLRIAARTAAGLAAYGASNTDSEMWLQDAFRRLAQVFPDPDFDLRMVDFNVEMDETANDLLPARYDVASNLYAVPTDNPTAINKARLERLKFEIFRYLKAGVPVRGIGYQFHTSSYHAGSLNNFRMSLWDWNRWGIRPAITEANADRNAPGHLGSSPAQIVVDRYNAVHHGQWMEALLTETTCRDVIAWSPARADGKAESPTTPLTQTTTNKDTDNPIRAATALALSRAKPASERKLKRGSVTSFKNRIPMWIEATGTQSMSGNRVAQTAAGYVRRGWDWYNDPSWASNPRAMPISAETMILRAQFYVNSNSFPAAGATIIGEFSADGASGAALVGKLSGGTNKLFVRQRIGGVNTDIEVPGVTLSTTNNLRQCAYMAFSADRSSVKVGYGTLTVTDSSGVVTVTPSSIAEQTIALPSPQPIKMDGHVYCVSDAQGTAFHSSLQVGLMMVFHGPDYPTDAERQALAIPHRQAVYVPNINGAIYYGD